MKKWVAAILFGSALVLGACGGDGDNNSADADPGAEIYKKSCSSCHGSDLEGTVGPGLTDVGSKYSAEDIEDIIQNGIGNMNPVNVNDDDRKVLSEWLANKK